MNIKYRLELDLKPLHFKVDFWNDILRWENINRHVDLMLFIVEACVFWPCSSVDQELGFQDKYLFYRFLDDEEEDTPLPSEEEKRESEEELPETILFLAQIGPDALLRMILRKSSVLFKELQHQGSPLLHYTKVLFYILLCRHCFNKNSTTLWTIRIYSCSNLQLFISLL